MNAAAQNSTSSNSENGSSDPQSQDSSDDSSADTSQPEDPAASNSTSSGSANEETAEDEQGDGGGSNSTSTSSEEQIEDQQSQDNTSTEMTPATVATVPINSSTIQTATELVNISGEPLLPSDKRITRTFSYPLLEFNDDDTVDLTVTIVWNTDGTVEVSDDRGYKYTLTIPTSSGMFTLLSNSTTIDQKFISDELQFDLYWTPVENSDGDVTKYKFIIAGTSLKENSEITLGLDGGQHVRIAEDRFTVEQPDKKVDALSDGEQKLDPSLDWTPSSVKEQNNNIPPQESLFSRDANEAASGDFGLDWSDAVASGYGVEFNATTSSIQIPVGKSFVIDPTTVATVPLQVSPSTSESSEGERRVVRIGSKLFAFYYDGSNILYRTSTDDGYTWSSSTSLETGVVASDYHRWAVAATSVSGSNYISVLYWVPNGSNMDFYALRGTVTASSVTWSDHILLGYTWANSSACGSGGACAAAVASADTQGNIYAAFTWLSGGATQYSYQIMKSTDGGLTWSTSLSQVYPVSTSKPTMALTNLDSGKMLFAYTNYDSSDFKYRVYSGSAWGSEQTTSAGSGMSTNTLKQISAASNSTNFGFIAYVTGGTSGSLKVARFSNTGTFQAYETANSTLTHSLPSITIPPHGADSIIRIYTIAGGKVYETKKVEGTWQNSFNPFGTSFTSLNQLSAAANDPSALWIENSANPYNLRFGRDIPTITWTLPSGNVWAVPNVIQQLNFTADVSMAYADVVMSSQISNYASPLQEDIYDIPAGEMQSVGMILEIPPNSVAGWHNGTVFLSIAGGQESSTYGANIKVPTMSKTTVEVEGGTVDYVLTPANSPYFSDTSDLSTYFTFDNGTRKLLRVVYDIFPPPSEEFGGFSAMAIFAPIISWYNDLVGSFSSSNPEISSFVPQWAAYAQQTPECTGYGFSYNWQRYGAGGANVPGDLQVASTTLNSNSSSPLLVRLDIRWADIDHGEFDSNGNWIEEYDNDALIDEIFDEVVNSSDKKAIIILGTNQPPAAIKTDGRAGLSNIGTAVVDPDSPNSTEFLPLFRGAANDFVEHVVNYIKSNSTMMSRVQYFQIDNEPNLRPPITSTDFLGALLARPNWAMQSDALNEWLSIVKQADASKKTIINVWQDEPGALVIGDRTIAPYDNLLRADTQIGQQLASNLDVMGFDIYPDAAALPASDSEQISDFSDALEQAGEQLDNARTEFSFAGGWGILELAAGPKDDVLFAPSPTPTTVGEMALLAKNASFETPELISFFQLRADNNPEFFPWHQSYGLINHGSGSVNTSFQDAINDNVIQNCLVE